MFPAKVETVVSQLIRDAHFKEIRHIRITKAYESLYRSNSTEQLLTDCQPFTNRALSTA